MMCSRVTFGPRSRTKGSLDNSQVLSADNQEHLPVAVLTTEYQVISTSQESEIWNWEAHSRGTSGAWKQNWQG